MIDTLPASPQKCIVFPQNQSITLPSESKTRPSFICQPRIQFQPCDDVFDGRFSLGYPRSAGTFYYTSFISSTFLRRCFAYCFHLHAPSFVELLTRTTCMECSGYAQHKGLYIPFEVVRYTPSRRYAHPGPPHQHRHGFPKKNRSYSRNFKNPALVPFRPRILAL